MPNLADHWQETIIVCITGTVIVAIVEYYSGDKNITETPGKIFVGGFIAGGLLLGLGYLLPAYAAGLALVGLVATILVKGNPFWTAINNLFPSSKTGTVSPAGKQLNQTITTQNSSAISYAQTQVNNGTAPANTNVGAYQSL